MITESNEEENNNQTGQVVFVMREVCKNCPEKINLICEDCVYGGPYIICGQNQKR